jgi:flagellar hook-associated protein 1 FlgK
MPDMLNTAVSGLLSFQRALGTVSHNIANVNTEGYSRQSVEFESNIATKLGGSFFGSGVHIESVNRAYDQFLTQEVRDTTSVYSKLNQFAELSAHIDDVLADPQGGISPILQDFFSSIQDVADDPASSTARFALINTAQSFSERFHNIDTRLEQLSQNTTTDIRNVVAEINSLVVSIRDVNIALNEVGTSATGTQQSNDLLDKRDAFLTELSQKIEITVVKGSDNNMSIFIGNGQSMLTGTTASSLTAEPNSNDPSQDVIVYNGNIIVFDLSAQLKGGELGGLLDFRSNVLTPTRNSLGRTAIGVAEAVNAQMRSGMDLNGNLGEDMFSYNSPEVISASTNAGTATVSAQVSNIAALTTSDYTLTLDGAGTSWTLTSGSGTTATVANGNPATLVFEGLTLTINGATAVAGDQFKVKPTIGGAASINVAITDSNAIAAAAPIRTGSSLSNLGTVTISPGVVTDPANLLTPPPPALGGVIAPVNFTFSSATSFTSNVSVVVDGVLPAIPAGTAIVYTNNMSLEANGFQVSLDGQPQTGDQLTVESNVGGSGDNRNALSLAKLQNMGLLNGGNASFQEDYGTLVGFVGSQTLAANVSRDAHESLLTQALSRNSSRVGVNLDEEAANLIRFQQAYEAAARVISTVQTMFDTIIQSTR